MNPNTFFYFFSTSAQCFAGIAALALVAIQMRLSFLDAIVTRRKRTAIAQIHNTSAQGPIEHDMAAYTATEILKRARQEERSKPTIVPVNDALVKAINKIQSVRVKSAWLLSSLLIVMVIILLELPFSEHISGFSQDDQKLILCANSFVIMIATGFVLWMVFQVLNIQLRRSVDTED